MLTRPLISTRSQLLLPCATRRCANSRFENTCNSSVESHLYTESRMQLHSCARLGRLRLMQYGRNDRDDLSPVSFDLHWLALRRIPPPLRKTRVRCGFMHFMTEVL
jgi:hypothetical protein